MISAVTRLATLPPGSRVTVGDPYAERRAIWPQLVLFTLALAALATLAVQAGWLP